MKNKLSLLVLAVLLGGCATLNAPATTARAERIAALATYTACVADVTERPINRGNWLAALGGLKVLVDNETWDYLAFVAALEKAGVPEMTGTEGRLIIRGGVLVWDLFLGDSINLDDSAFVKAVVLGSYRGIDLALNDALKTVATTAGVARAPGPAKAEALRLQLEKEAQKTRP